MAATLMRLPQKTYSAQQILRRQAYRRKLKAGLCNVCNAPAALQETSQVGLLMERRRLTCCWVHLRRNRSR